MYVYIYIYVLLFFLNCPCEVFFHFTVWLFCGNSFLLGDMVQRCKTNGVEAKTVFAAFCGVFCIVFLWSMVFHLLWTAVD